MASPANRETLSEPNWMGVFTRSESRSLLIISKRHLQKSVGRIGSCGCFNGRNLRQFDSLTFQPAASEQRVCLSLEELVQRAQPDLRGGIVLTIRHEVQRQHNDHSGHTQTDCRDHLIGEHIGDIMSEYFVFELC